MLDARWRCWWWKSWWCQPQTERFYLCLSTSKADSPHAAMATQNDFPAFFFISLHAFSYFRAHPSIFSCTVFYISLDLFSYFPVRRFITSWSYCSFSAFISELMLYFILRVLSIPSDHFQELFIVSVKIGHFSLFWSKNRTPFRFWPSLAHFLGVFCSLTIMQICFQISIVYPRRALSASVCVVAVAGAGLSLQIQFSLKIRATLSSSSPGFFIASASHSVYPPSCTHSTIKWPQK